MNYDPVVSLVCSAQLWSLSQSFPLFQITGLLVDRVESLVELSGLLLPHHCQQLCLIVRQPGTKIWIGGTLLIFTWGSHEQSHRWAPHRHTFHIPSPSDTGKHCKSTMVSNKKVPLEWPRTAQVVGPLWEWAPCRYPGCRYNLSGNQILQHCEVGSAEGQTLMT